MVSRGGGEGSGAAWSGKRNKLKGDSSFVFSRGMMICDKLSDIMKACVFLVSEYKWLYVLHVLAKTLPIKLGILYEFSWVCFFPRFSFNVLQDHSKVDHLAKLSLIESSNNKLVSKSGSIFSGLKKWTAKWIYFNNKCEHSEAPSLFLRQK